jgi:DNA-binding transcriptional LysR family regulator
MLDQLRQIAIFAKTIDHGSFRGAARELRLSPSVVSHHISQLEEHLGVALIHRSTRKLALTREGEQLLASTRHLLEAVDNVFSELSDSTGIPSGEIRITTPSVLIQSHLTDLLASFSMDYPQVKLSLDFTDVRQDLIDGGLDIAIRMGIQAKKSATSRILFQLRRRLVASKAYLEHRPKVSSPEDLLDWDWIELSPVHHIKPTFRKSKSRPIIIKPKAHISTNDAVAMYRLARAGAGLAVVPEFLAEEDVAAGLVEYVLPSWALESIDVFATWPANAPRHGLIKLFINEICQKQSEHTMMSGSSG